MIIAHSESMGMPVVAARDVTAKVALAGAVLLPLFVVKPPVANVGAVAGPANAGAETNRNEAIPRHASKPRVIRLILESPSATRGTMCRA